MNALTNALKSEISRVARKELKGELSALKTAATAHRGEIAALKRELKALRSLLASNQKAVKSIGLSAVETEKSPSPKARFSARGFGTLRTKLGISQAQMAQLLEVSALSVYKWESGKTRPRAAQLMRIQAVRKMGKREVNTRLA